jgi:hypothetical protein
VQFSVARLDLRLTGACGLVTAAYRRGARYLFCPVAMAFQFLLALAGLVAVLAAIASGQRFALRVSPDQVPIAIGLSLAAVSVHELAHALVVVRCGRTIDAAGIRLHLGTPACYVESASAVLLTRRQRLIQAAAGVWAEWLFTSVIAIWLWLAPPPQAGPMLHRFVILNAVTIASNLLPFTGLDGAWLLADAVGMPDLSRRARGAVTRRITAMITRQPCNREDSALAAYAAVNGLVAAALLATAGFFWYQLFGSLIGTLAGQGPAGWAVLAVAAIVLGRPAVAASAAQLPTVLDGVCRLGGAITLSRLLPPSPPTRGSGCLQLHPAAATAGRLRSSTSIRTNSASWRTYMAGTTCGRLGPPDTPPAGPAADDQRVGRVRAAARASRGGERRGSLRPRSATR